MFIHNSAAQYTKNRYPERSAPPIERQLNPVASDKVPYIDEINDLTNGASHPEPNPFVLITLHLVRVISHPKYMPAPPAPAPPFGGAAASCHRTSTLCAGPQQLNLPAAPRRMVLRFNRFLSRPSGSLIGPIIARRAN